MTVTDGSSGTWGQRLLEVVSFLLELGGTCRINEELGHYCNVCGLATRHAGKSCAGAGLHTAGVAYQGGMICLLLSNVAVVIVVVVVWLPRSSRAEIKAEGMSILA